MNWINHPARQHNPFMTFTRFPCCVFEVSAQKGTLSRGYLRLSKPLKSLLLAPRKKVM